MRMPTEAEIVDAARELGHLDENGQYPRRLRPKLAAAIQAQWEEAAMVEAEGDTPRPTADVLADLDRDLLTVGLVDLELRGPVLAQAAAHLLGTFGLQLIPDSQPDRAGDHQ